MSSGRGSFGPGPRRTDICGRCVAVSPVGGSMLHPHEQVPEGRGGPAVRRRPPPRTMTRLPAASGQWHPACALRHRPAPAPAACPHTSWGTDRGLQEALLSGARVTTGRKRPPGASIGTMPADMTSPRAGTVAPAAHPRHLARSPGSRARPAPDLRPPTAASRRPIRASVASSQAPAQRRAPSQVHPLGSSSASAIAGTGSRTTAEPASAHLAVDGAGPALPGIPAGRCTWVGARASVPTAALPGIRAHRCR